MARISNKDKALAYAAEHGIILTVEDDMSVFDPDSNTYTVEVWSLRAHLSETGSECHTYFAHGTTEPRAWADALAYMVGLVPCMADCDCYGGEVVKRPTQSVSVAQLMEEIRYAD